MNWFVWVCWRAVYPVLVYLLLFDLMAVIGIAEGVGRIGASAGLCVVLFWPVYFGKEKEEIRVNYPKVMVFGVMFWIIGNFVLSCLPITSTSYEQTAAVLFGAPLWQQILMVGFLAPFAEELVFRGLIFSRLRETMQFLPAAGLSALLFAGFHGNIVQGIYAFFGGLLMAWSYETYHGLKAPYCIHVISNLLSIVLSIFTLGATGR